MIDMIRELVKALGLSTFLTWLKEHVDLRITLSELTLVLRWVWEKGI